MSLNLARRQSNRPTRIMTMPAVAAMTVVVIEDVPAIGEPLREGLRGDGHTVHLCSKSTSLIDEIARLQPDAILVNLNLNDRESRELIRKVRARFAYVYLIVYTSWTAQTVRDELHPDLVLSQLPPVWLASQLRCWARYV